MWNNVEILNLADISRGGGLCLSFHLYTQTGQRKVFSFSFFLFWLVGAQCLSLEQSMSCSVYRSSKVWVSDVTVAALCISQQQWLEQWAAL